MASSTLTSPGGILFRHCEMIRMDWRISSTRHRYLRGRGRLGTPGGREAGCPRRPGKHHKSPSFAPAQRLCSAQPPDRAPSSDPSTGPFPRASRISSDTPYGTSRFKQPQPHFGPQNRCDQKPNTKVWQGSCSVSEQEQNVKLSGASGTRHGQAHQPPQLQNAALTGSSSDTGQGRGK